MIASVTFAKTTYAELPNKFEAGTPHIAGAIGLGAAIDFVQSVGVDNIARARGIAPPLRHREAAAVPRVRLVGTAAEKAGVLSFVVEDPPLSSLDVGMQLDLDGIAVRTGHHCCQPIMDRFNVPATARASFAVYNTTAEIDVFVDSLRRIVTGGGPKPVTVGVPASGEIIYPKAYAASPLAAAEKWIEAFDLLGEGDERYRYLEELGKKLLPMPAELKTDANRINGCQSIVHLSARVRPGNTDVLEFLSDSDSQFVKGELLMLQRIYSGHKVQDILAFDVERFFERLSFISDKRRTGLNEMVKRIRSIAALVADAQQGQSQTSATA